MSGHTFAMGRIRAQDSVEGTVREFYSGYEGYIALKGIYAELDEKFDELLGTLSALMMRFITRERLTVSIVGEYSDSYAGDIVGGVKNGEKCHPVCEIAPLQVD